MSSFRLRSIVAGLIAGVVVVTAGTARATDYYWDTNGTTAGLGDTAGTWGTSAFVASLAGGNSRAVLNGTFSTANTATTTSDWIYFGTVNLGLGSTASTVTVGTRSIGNIVFGAGQTNPVTLSGGTLTLAAAGSVTVNNTSDTISSVLASATTSFTKNGAGTLNLTGANTYTGTTIVSGGGTLTVGDGTTGSLNGTTRTGLTFNNGGGTFNVAEATSSTQGMGTLTFSAGDGTVTSTAAGASPTTATLTFDSLAARAAGATGNFSLATNTTASENKIVLASFFYNTPADDLGNDAGIFFGGNEYARYADPLRRQYLYRHDDRQGRHAEHLVDRCGGQSESSRSVVGCRRQPVAGQRHDPEIHWRRRQHRPWLHDQRHCGRPLRHPRCLRHRRSQLHQHGFPGVWNGHSNPDAEPDRLQHRRQHAGGQHRQQRHGGRQHHQGRRRQVDSHRHKHLYGQYYGQRRHARDYHDHRPHQQHDRRRRR